MTFGKRFSGSHSELSVTLSRSDPLLEESLIFLDSMLESAAVGYDERRSTSRYPESLTCAGWISKPE